MRLFGRITTDNILPDRQSEGADPQREPGNVRPNSLEMAMRSNQASPRARGPALLRTGASATSSAQGLFLLTGDSDRTAQSIATLAGVDEVASDLKPEQKVERIVELAQKYGPVLMVGDGVNDAPALAAASVGVAMRRRGHRCGTRNGRRRPHGRRPREAGGRPPPGPAQPDRGPSKPRRSRRWSSRAWSSGH